VEFDSSGIIVPTGNGSAMALDIIGEMHMAPIIIAKAPVLITTGQQGDTHHHNYNNCNKLFHIISSLKINL
jgi:hypothetical protein